MQMGGKEKEEEALSNIHHRDIAPPMGLLEKEDSTSADDRCPSPLPLPAQLIAKVGGSLDTPCPSYIRRTVSW